MNEHIQRRKLSERNPLFAILADKVEVKQFVADRLGSKYVIPTLWSGTRLPEPPAWPAPFVVKANHGSGWNIFVKGDDPSEWTRVRHEAESWLTRAWYPHRHEWWYNLIDRQILVEPMLGESLTDYKFFCFGGRARTIQVDVGRFSNQSRSFYSPAWEREPFSIVEYPAHPEPLPPPKHLADMIAMAETLASGFDFVRVDLYSVDSGPLFGEMTFTPGAGFGKFDPPEYDFLLGSYWPSA